MYSMKWSKLPGNLHNLQITDTCVLSKSPLGKVSLIYAAEADVNTFKSEIKFFDLRNKIL